MNPVSAELFDGLDPALVAEIFAGSQRRSFRAGDVLCDEGAPGDSVLMIERGAAEVLVGHGSHRVRHLRRGDIVGEIALITGDPRSATVRAIVPTDVVEIHRDTVTSAIGRDPRLLFNLSRVLSRRLARAHVEHGPTGRGEAVGLVLQPSAASSAGALLAEAARATPRAVTSLAVAADAPAAVHVPSASTAARALDDLLATHGLVFVAVAEDTPDLRTLLAQLDRTVVIGTGAEVSRLVHRLSPPVLAEALVIDGADLRTALGDMRTHRPGSLPASLPWIARHLTRTHLGLALGAGGAKGYAHVGVLATVEEAGYTVDQVSGSSIGAIAGACIAMGMDSAEIEAVLRKRFTPEVVKAVFNLSFSGSSAGYETMQALTRDLVGDRSFDDLQIPFVAMAVDLNTRLPVPISTGSLADALLASTALAGLFPPFEREGQRLVDGLALVPVPVAAAVERGADITVAVNLMSRDTLPAWPGEEPAPPPTGKQRMLETLLEVMDLTQLDASVRHAATADVTVTPRFGPCTWRDFHLADQFLAAGREAAAGALGRLPTFATPMHKGEVHG